MDNALTMLAAHLIIRERVKRGYVLSVAVEVNKNVYQYIAILKHKDDSDDEWVIGTGAEYNEAISNCAEEAAGIGMLHPYI